MQKHLSNVPQDKKNHKVHTKTTSHVDMLVAKQHVNMLRLVH